MVNHLLWFGATWVHFLSVAGVRSQPMREDVAYVCNDFSHWLWPYSVIDKNLAQVTTAGIGNHKLAIVLQVLILLSQMRTSTLCKTTCKIWQTVSAERYIIVWYLCNLVCTSVDEIHAMRYALRLIVKDAINIIMGRGIMVVKRNGQLYQNVCLIERTHTHIYICVYIYIYILTWKYFVIHVDAWW